MFYSLLILLHRPFVPKGHLEAATNPRSGIALHICEDAAQKSDAILRFYRVRWDVSTPPYFMSYATYVSATIHVRMTLRQSHSSKAHQCFINCLEILAGHQTCEAARKCLAILLGLAKRLGVDIGDFLLANPQLAQDERSETNGSNQLFSVGTSSLVLAPSYELSEDRIHPSTTEDASHLYSSANKGTLEEGLVQADSSDLILHQGLDPGFLDFDLDNWPPDILSDFDSIINN